MDPSLTYREKFLKNQMQFSAKYRQLFDKVAMDISTLANNPMAKFTKDFNFHRVIDQKIAIIMTAFHDKALELTENEIRKSWDFSTAKNDKIINDYLGTLTAVKGASLASYFLPNISALEAFIARDHGTGTLSDNIWKVAGELRAEMEIHLGIGLTNGDSAQVISRRIRQYLQNPEVLFRRVRDANGKLVASKKMIEYRDKNKLTQGTYTSAYKNAMRLARSTTNQAYLLADHIRWMQLVMVIGVKISLSDQHPDYKQPEICEICEGIYPKDYVWTGWHVCCLCFAVPVLMDKADFLKQMDGNEPLKAKQITKYPVGFQNYVKDNHERLSKYKSVPYFISDNEAVISSIMEKKV
jgi:hypothetical protein